MLQPLSTALRTAASPPAPGSATLTHTTDAPGSCLALGWRSAPPGGAERAAQEDRPGGGGHQALGEVVPLPAGEAVVFSAVQSGRNWVLQGEHIGSSQRTTAASP